MLIGDRENETVAGKFAEKPFYRTDGTQYEFGQQLERLLDTVHFTHPHHSRMLQLADLHAWLWQLREAGDQGPMAPQADSRARLDHRRLPICAPVQECQVRSTRTLLKPTSQNEQLLETLARGV
jgi:hypothetical protein